MSINPDIEKSLIDRFSRGDEEAFETIFKAYYSNACTFAQSFVKDPEIAKDVVQETFIRLWDKRFCLKIETSFKSYLFRSIYNASINAINKNKLLSQKSKEIIEEITFQNQLTNQNLNADIIEEISARELEIEIEKAIEKLPRQCNEVFKLSRNGQFSYAQIAEKLDVSVNTVKTQMKRALARLREVIEKK